MSVSFVDGVLAIDEEIRLEVPTPLDIPVPTPPVVPSFEFPPIPDVVADVISIKARLDALKAVQGANPSFNLSSGGYSSVPGSNPGGGGDTEEITEVPSSSVDFDLLASSINISLPTPPVVPSLDFPPIPDVAGDVISIKSRLDYFKSLQSSNPDLSIDTGGAAAVQGSGGQSFEFKSEIPSAEADFDLLASSINIPLPVPPVVPSLDFPPIPNPSDLFGNIGIDPETYKKSENNESSPGYSPTAPKVSVKVFVNGAEV